MTNLSPAAQAVWEAFNQDEPGVFVDYGDCLAAALRAAADQVVPKKLMFNYLDDYELGVRVAREEARVELLAIATELEGVSD